MIVNQNKKKQKKTKKYKN